MLTTDREDSGRAPEPRSVPSGAPEAESGNDSHTSDAPEKSTPPGSNRVVPTERAVIRIGNVALEHEDVGEARFDLREVVDRHHGEVGDQETSTDHDGVIDRLRFEIRVPSKEFDDAMAEIGEIGRLRSSEASAEDVTSEVIDVDSRVKSQERSIARIQRLLAEADNLNQVISIESQLATRQADLDSLKSQLAHLQDPSSMSTIIVHVSKAPEDAVDEQDDEKSGFMSGLSDSWSGMKTAASGIATAAGLVLPFAVVLLVLAVPVRLLLRNRRRTLPTTTPTP